MNTELDSQVVIGEHAILEILRKRPEDVIQIFYTHKSRPALERVIHIGRDSRFLCLKESQFRIRATEVFQQHQHDPTRVPAGLLAITRPLVVHDLGHIWSKLGEQSCLKLLALDQVTDLGNAAAILRTCAFYGIDGFLLSQKGSAGLSPKFFQIASGATERVPIYRMGSLTTALKKLSERGVLTVGLAESGKQALGRFPAKEKNAGSCLVLGSEDAGLSHAVERVLDEVCHLSCPTDFTTLNVSVAAAVSIERFFRQKN